MPQLRIPGLPDFNAEGSVYLIDDLTNWWSTPPTSLVILPNGGGPGGVAGGKCMPTEEYKTLSGTVLLPYDQQDQVRRALLVNLPGNQDVALGYVGEGWQPDQQAWVRAYDRCVFDREPNYMSFQIPLVMLDPYKYGLEPLLGTFGVHAGQTWTRGYTNITGTLWTRGYTNLTGTLWVRGYTLQELAEGGHPQAAVLDSQGDIASRRIRIAVTGPLAAGGWYLTNTVTGQRMWALMSVVEGQALTFDSQRRRADLDGIDVTDKVFGDWLTLEPGPNEYRLIAANPTPAAALVNALEAYI